VYEINTAVWLQELSRAAGRRIGLGDVGPADWDSVTPRGVDAVWLMGVWERSPAGLQIALGNESLQASFREALEDVAPRDVIGSPYCVRRYLVEALFGGPEGLAAARAALASRGVKLFLDYVPNHVAPDHPWTTAHPEWLVRGNQDDLHDDPAGWLEVGATVLAHGRDPYFPPWPDVVQLDAFSAGTRQATIDTLSAIAEQCDGIRCDMAMLLTNEVFARTWHGRTGPPPEEEFWPTVIGAMRIIHPDTVLVAEAYWDMEWALQQQGFDYCYDKRLYDRILEGAPSSIRDHLRAGTDYQNRLLRFLENHDEPRIAAHLGAEAERAAAVMIATLPGTTLWHEGQFEGRRVRPPVFLQRRPDEAPDQQLADWYREMIAAVGGSSLRGGEWHLLEAEGWPDNRSCDNLLAWSWSDGAAPKRYLVVINWSGDPAQGRIRLGWGDLAGREWRMTDLLRGTAYDRDGNELSGAGLFVDLGPWEFHLLEMR
jgi:hypothetical protein